MSSLADYAPAEATNQANARRGPSPWVTALLTVLTPGLGHIYIGQARRGIVLFVLVIMADTLLMFAMMGVLARFWMFAVSLGLLFGLWLYILFDAIQSALPDARPSRTRAITVGRPTRALSCSPASYLRRHASMPFMPRRRASCCG